MGKSSKLSEIAPGARFTPRADPVYEFDGFRLDCRERTLTQGDTPVALTPKVFDTLVLLVTHNGHLVTKEALLSTLWPDTFVEEVNLSQNISVLRKALGESAQRPRYITTVQGRGYRFTAPVTLAPVAGHEEDDVRHGAALTAAAARVTPHRAGLRTSAVVAASAGVLAVAVAGVVWWLATASGPRSATTRPRFDPQHTRISRLTESGKAPNAAIAPDAGLVTYIEIDGDEFSLWTKQIATGERRAILPRQRDILRHLAISPDARFVYFTRQDAGQLGFTLYRLALAGGTPQKLLLDVDTPVSFSPDGRQLAFMRGVEPDSQIVIADVDGGHQRVLASRKTPLSFSYVGPAWSPDGSLIAATAGDTSSSRRWSIQLISVADGSSRELFGTEWVIGRARWLPDGTGLLTVVSETLSRQFPAWQAATGSHVTGGSIWHVAWPSGTATKLTSDLVDYDVCCLDLSADGRTMTAVQNSLVSNLWVAPTDHLDQLKQITWGPPLFQRHTWLPDNSAIVYRDLTGHLNRVGRNGDAMPMATPDRQLVVSGVSTCGQGRFVLFESTLGHSIWRADADGANAIRLTTGPLDTSPACFGGGASAVYTSMGSEFPTIWQVAIGGGEPHPLIDRHSLEAVPSPSGRLLYDWAIEWEQSPSPVQHMRWVVTDLETGHRIVGLERPSGTVLGLGPVWAPDESGLDYVLTKGGISNIWRQPLKGGGPVQITHFTSGQIFSFAWSPDGRWLSLGSGANRSDVVLITSPP